MAKYRKKPVVIEAWFISGNPRAHDADTRNALAFAKAKGIIGGPS